MATVKNAHVEEPARLKVPEFIQRVVADRALVLEQRLAAF